MKKKSIFLMCIMVSVTIVACSGKNSDNVSSKSGSGLNSVSSRSNSTDLTQNSTDNTKSQQSGSASKTSKIESNTEDKNSDRKLTDMLDTICKGTKVPAYDLIELNKENFQWYGFTKWIDGIEAACSEGQITTNAHSIVLIRVNNGDSAKIAEEISKKADLRKWICVEAEEGKVLYTDKYVLMVMTYKKAFNDIEANFKKLMGNSEVKSFEIKSKLSE